MNWKKLTDFTDNKIFKPPYNITYWKIENGKIWHQWKKLMKADIESFEVHENNDFIARDKNFVYFAWTKLPKVDRDSFEEVENGYWKDKQYAYVEYETSIKPLKGLDVSSFKYIGNGYAYDKNFAYFCGRVIKSCNHPTTLQVIENEEAGFFVKDKENIFYESAMLKNAHLKTWQPIKNGFSKDEKSVYYGAKKLTKVDINTWEHLYRSFSKDKNNVYSMNLIEKDKSPNKWDKQKVMESYEQNLF